jgi:cell division protein FtsB
MWLPGRTSLWAVLALSAALSAASLAHPSGLPRLRAVQADVARYEAENETLRRENDRLKSEIVLLGSDAYLERVVREELGYLRADELLFQIR